MKLFLASQDFGKHVDRLQELVGANKKVLFTLNARDYYDEKDRVAKIGEKQKMFESAGFEFIELDLRNYFGQMNELDEFITRQKPGLVFAAGGNNFILRRAMSYSGFDDIINREVRSGRVVYGGCSAGAIVAGPSLAYLEQGNDLYIDPSGYRHEIIWEGLGLIEERIIPHYDDPDYHQVSLDREAVFKNLDLPYIALNADGVVVVDGDKKEILQ